MDAIVSGKDEKAEGSFMFKTEEVLNIHETSLRKTFTIEEKNSKYLKMVSLTNFIIILPISSILIGDNERNWTKLLVNNKNLDLYFTTHDTLTLAFFVSGDYALSSLISSAEIGTLE